jgi:DNA-binding IclR family transcriptional regulator
MRVQSVERAVAILNEFSASRTELGVTQLGERLDLHKSTVHRLLASLVQGGLVERDPRSRKYRLGIRLVDLGNTVLSTRGLPQVALPFLRYLSDAVEEVTYLAVRDGDQILNILQVPGPQLVQSVKWLGRGPLHCTSTGKIFLAHMPEDELKPLLDKELARMTANTMTDPTDLKHELERVREQGFAAAFEEHQEGINAIAAPITKPDGTAIAAVGVAGPSYRFTRDRAMSFTDVIRSIAREVSQQLQALPSGGLDLYV